MITRLITLIDNYDSFTYNIVQLLQTMGHAVVVVKNDETSVEAIRAQNPQAIVLSPGPGAPKDAGICLELIASVAGEIPILGICLGHQCIAQAFGASVIPAASLVHGRAVNILHDGQGVYQNLPAKTFKATRYNSLTVAPTSVSPPLLANAWEVDEQGERSALMGVKHADWPIVGFQFHPESILSEQGEQLLASFLQTCKPVNER